jgi:methylmalonyl-CoA/ethylmalonyl-CoA epimerase
MATLSEEFAKRFYQVSYAVCDLGKARQFFEDTMGVKFEVFELTLGPSEFTLRGKPAELRIRGALGDLPGRGVQLELIEPADDKSIYHEFLARSGPGLHHVAFMVADYGGTKKWLEGLGLKRVQEGISLTGQFSFAYFDCEFAGASMIEVVWNHAAASLLQKS